MADDARRHHYVPACYLRHFSLPNDRYEGRLYVYDRVAGRTFQSSPDKSAHQRDFYRVEVDGEHQNLAENAFEALETRFAPTIAGVNERGTLPTDSIAIRELLAFVASQAVRTPRVREMQAKAYSDVHMLVLRQLADNKEAFMKQLREWDPGIPALDAEEMFATHVEFVNAKGARVEMDQTTMIRDVLELAGELEDVLAQRHWILGRPPDGTSFITTDDPVILQWAAIQKKPRHPLWSPGFGDRNTTVMVPIGPQLILIGLSYPHDRARVRFTREQVAALNTDLSLAARRFLYSTEPTFAQVTAKGDVVVGPTDGLRRSEDPPPPAFGGLLEAP